MPTIRHIHLPGLTPYSHVSNLQDILVSQFLRYKAALSKQSPSIPPSPLLSTVPTPTILTFSPYPIYTTGRREVTPPTPHQLELLTSPLPTASGPQVAEFQHALRGGQITFHGPGQLVVYPILSLSTPESFPSNATSTSSSDHQHYRGGGQLRGRGTTARLTPRTYVALLESTTARTLMHYDIPTTTSAANPGLWLRRDMDVKIAALGVHLRRNVTSHGVGLNVATDLRWFDRIVACGLEGKGVSSMVVEQADLGRRGLGVEEVAAVWVREFAKGVGLAEEDIAVERRRMS